VPWPPPDHVNPYFPRGLTEKPWMIEWMKASASTSQNEMWFFCHKFEGCPVLVGDETQELRMSQETTFRARKRLRIGRPTYRRICPPSYAAQARNSIASVQPSEQ
jgi:hypothetical protein